MWILTYFFEGQILLDILAERTTLDSTLEGAVLHALTMLYLPIRPNLELKTWLKQLLGSLLLDILLFGQSIQTVL